ncbi:MAG: DUF2147 domain-containing protein [Saprospiraceae bacterium]|nr:DUF2147 domain-containing protein [Saprospiraceae bacterium]
MLTKKLTTTALLLAFACAIWAQPAFTGTWKTINEETNQADGHVEIYKSGNSYFGKVVKMIKDPADSKCDKCTGNRHNKPIMNMVILENMVLDDDELQDGKILDPNNGKWYTCKMWLKKGEPNTLVVRGYLFGFYRTQYWYRVK